MSEKADILILPIGGLGASQMSSVRDHYAADPRCTVVWTPEMDFNAYKIDIGLTIKDIPHERLVLIGHSFAGIPILQYINDNPGAVSYAGMIDPVSCKPLVSSWPAPKPMPPYNWFVRSDFGIEVKMTILGLPDPIVVPGGHNDIVHSAWVLAEMDRGVFGETATPAPPAPPPAAV